MLLFLVIFEFNYSSTFCQSVVSQAPQAIFEWDFFVVYVNVVCFRKCRKNFFPNFVRVLLLYSSTRNKHTCTKHPAIANMRIHFIFLRTLRCRIYFSPETVIYTSRVSDNHRTCILIICSLKFLVVLNASGRVI